LWLFCFLRQNGHTKSHFGDRLLSKNCALKWLELGVSRNVNQSPTRARALLFIVATCRDENGASYSYRVCGKKKSTEDNDEKDPYQCCFSISSRGHNRVRGAEQERRRKNEARGFKAGCDREHGSDEGQR